MYFINIGYRKNDSIIKVSVVLSQEKKKEKNIYVS